MAKISANKLAELLTCASAARRRKIVYDQKFPADVIVARYRQAAAPITEFMTAEEPDTACLRRAVAALRADNSGTEWAMDDRQNTADALEHFIEIGPEIARDGVVYQAGRIDAERLDIQGVSVSVRPDFVSTFRRRGKLYSGAVKLHFIKNEESALQRRGAEFVAVMLHRWLTEHGPADATPMHSACLSIDVFRRSIVSAPQSVTRRWEEISAGCEEVAARWAQIEQ